ncbi:MAG: 2-hydroxyacid dehydrogenase [Defluviitaleaceae bacterium]|nr:2-hydroxyacid dehydrogenase [Defluviitaleaceae bacterium]
MKKIAVFDTKPYDIEFFDKYKNEYDFEIDYFESKLRYESVALTKGYDAVIAFVNDNINSKTIDKLIENGIDVIGMRCAGFNNIDVKHAKNKISIYRVPAYSPNAVAEHAMSLLMCLNRKIHKAHNRVRDFNFSLNGLVGFDLKGKTMGVVGTGKIGREFIKICNGFGMEVISYDPYPIDDENIEYVDLDYLFENSDIIALHCPLTRNNYHMINKKSMEMMKDGVIIINTSRGALIDTEDLLEAIKKEKVGGAALDVYEEEADFFFEDVSNVTIHDDVLKLLLSTTNVLVTSHQAFLTKEALDSIAHTTLQNLKDFFDDKENDNKLVL